MAIAGLGLRRRCSWFRVLSPHPVSWPLPLHPRRPDGQPGAVPAVCHLPALLPGHGPAGAAVRHPGGLPGQRGGLPRGGRRHVPVPQPGGGDCLGCPHRRHLLCPADPALHARLPLPPREAGTQRSRGRGGVANPARARVWPEKLEEEFFDGRGSLLWSQGQRLGLRKEGVD